MEFEDLHLSEPLLRAVKEEGYCEPTPIQAQAIPPALEGRDLLGCAQTGTGKTAAFALPILQYLASRKPARGKRPVRALILTPTRELALQIGECFQAYGRHLPLRCCVIFGGVSQKPQTDALDRGVDILVATPGRLNDLLGQGALTLESVDIFVLDEADRMLDMGFIHDVRKILRQIPRRKQTMLFSATMPPEISELVDSILTDPVRVQVTPVSSTVELIRQQVCFVKKADKKRLLAWFLRDDSLRSVLVFTRTKHGADRVVRELAQAGIAAQAIHGNKSQGARQQALGNFKSGKTRVLVATDIAARGIDVEEISHVINYDLPNIPETYVHRIGRTGRAGMSGTAISFCDGEERAYLADIEKLIRKPVPRMEEYPWKDEEPQAAAAVPKQDGAPQKGKDSPAKGKPQGKKRQTPSAEKASGQKGLEEKEYGSGASRQKGFGEKDTQKKTAAGQKGREQKAQAGKRSQPASKPASQGEPERDVFFRPISPSRREPEPPAQPRQEKKRQERPIEGREASPAGKAQEQQAVQERRTGKAQPRQEKKRQERPAKGREASPAKKAQEQRPRISKEASASLARRVAELRSSKPVEKAKDFASYLARLGQEEQKDSE